MKQVLAITGLMTSTPAMTYYPGGFFNTIQTSHVIVGAILVILVIINLFLLKIILNYRSAKKRQERVAGMLPMRFFVCDETGKILTANAEYQLQEQVRRAKKVRDLPAIDPQIDFIMDKIFETFRTDATIVQEFPKINRKIQLCKIEQSIFNKDAVLLSSFDATNEFTQRAEIKQRMRHHAAVINSIPQCIICFDRDGRITELNDAAEQLTGLIASNVVGTPEKQIFSFVSPRDNTPLPSPVAEVLQSGSGCERNTEIDLVLCNRNRISIRYKTNPIFNDKRHLDGVILIFQDETQSVRQQRNTEYRQKVLALAFEMTKAGYFTYSLKNRALIAGDGFERIWPRRDGLLLSETEWIYKDDLENFLAGREQLINGEKQLFEFTYRSNYFGKMCFYQLRAIRDLDESGEPAIFGVIQDISAINQIFSKHDDNSFVLQAIMKSLPCLFFIKDVSDDYRYLQASDAFCRFHNIKPETLIGKDDFDLFGDGRESSRMRSQDRQANRSNVPIEDYIDMTDRQNITHHFHVIRATHSNQYDRKLLFAIYFDQSEELKIQQNLKLERKFYLELLDRLPACVTVKNADDNFRYITWNRLLEEHTGLAASAVIGKTDFEIAPYPGAQQAIRDEDMAAMATDEPIKTRTSFITASGKTIHYSNVKTVLRSGNKNYVVELSLDVSNEDALETARLETLEKLNTQITNASIINSCLKRLSRENDFNRAVNDMLQIIGSSIGVDRCYIYLYPDGGEHPDCAFEWVRNGIISRKYNAIQPDQETLHVWNHYLRNKQAIHIDDVENASGEWSSCLKILKQENVRSVLMCGICLGEKLLGFIGIDAVRQRRSFSNSDVRMLNDAISIFQLSEQRMRHVERVKESLALQKMIMDMIQIPVVLLNSNYTVAHCNAAALKMLHVEPEAVNGAPCFVHVCHCSEPPAESCSLKKTLVTQQSVTIEKNINGIEYSITTIPIFHNGKISQVLESFVDLTEINKSKALLAKTASDAENAAKAKSLFLATMSHELRTPLNAVIGFAELLKLGNLSEQELKNAIDSIHLAGTTLLSLINDVLDLSKLEAGQMAIVPTRTNLGAMLNELHTIFAHKLKESKLSGVLELPPELPWLYLDNLRLRQIMLNLIGNAVKFTQQGGVTISVLFERAGEQYGNLTIMVRDTGIGISDEFITAIFDPFVQQEHRNGKTYQGTGLGLPICKRLVEQMNGTLEVQSVPGKGSCFTVKLPNVEYDDTDTIVETAPPESFPVLQGKLLLVDDVKLNLKILEAMSKKLGLQTRSADSGEAALELLREFKPDAVLTDMWMPEMNGAELAAKIRAIPEINSIKIVVVTADTEQAEVQKSGVFDGVLLKPITIDAIRKTLDLLNIKSKESPATGHMEQNK